MQIRNKNGKVVHSIIRWGSQVSCNDVDTKILVEFLGSKGRDCHINTGVHGMYPNANGEFEFAWDHDGGDHICQDAANFRNCENKVSLHPITKILGPLYHVGVDVVDAFCYSWHRKPTEEELDKVYEYFLIKEGIDPDSV